MTRGPHRYVVLVFRLLPNVVCIVVVMCTKYYSARNDITGSRELSCHDHLALLVHGHFPNTWTPYNKLYKIYFSVGEKNPSTQEV